MDWQEIYRRLDRGREDPDGWDALGDRVRIWGWRDFGGQLWDRIEDVVQDTLRRVWSSFDGAHGPETFKGFVYNHYRNARKVLIRELRKERRWVGLDDQVEVEGAGPGPEPGAGPDKDELELLGRCLGRLSDRERRAVELRYVGEASSKEMAAALGVTEGNARVVLSRGLGRLRECIRAESHAARRGLGWTA